jgi:phosphocarrier protein
MAAAKQSVTIVNKRGLHARASAKFVGAAAQMEGASITVTKDGSSAFGTSILGLMMLGAAMGDTITISAEGDAAETAVAALTELVEAKFGED